MTGDRGWARVRPVVPLIAGVVLLYATLLFALNAYRSPYPWINHDAAFLTYAGEEILRGERLYVEFQEMNPPGSHFLHAALAGVAGTLRLSKFLVIHGFVILLGAAGLWLMHHTYRRPEENPTLVLAGLSYLLVVLRGNFSNNVIPSAPSIPWDFGQREQMFALLFVPYVLWRLSGRKTSIPVYAYLVVLGYVAIFKPYWLALVLMVEAYAWFGRGKKAIRESATLGAGVALPYVVLLIHSPESFREFFRDVVPLMIGGAYVHYGMDYSEFVQTSLHTQMAVAGVVLLLLWGWCLTRRTVGRSKLYLLLVLTAGSYSIVVLQGKFWSYHGMVYFGVVTVGAAFLLGRVLGGGGAARWKPVVATVALVVVTVAIGSSAGNLRWMLRVYPPKGQELVEVVRGHEKVMFVSVAADYAYAPLVLDVDTVGPWREHFRLPALVAISDPAERSRALDDYARRVASRIEREQPDLLLFAPYSHGLPTGRHIHDILAPRGAVPRGRYVRVPEEEVSGRDLRLTGWILYRRER